MKLCTICKHYRSMDMLSWRKKACGCEKRKWKLTIKLIDKERWDKKIDLAKDCKSYRRKKNTKK